ncbi:hypothetical protein EMPS_08432 [Entomortierella parvispora]|uniref:ASTRA-associated protein 1 n=1 Tax=Entomortierella parvispora TaxID=205924 RepID=A0A9P3LZE0_9FUNG|nr:hypothetical protein EMPS_08432 [Entomortierella parvispora]
MSNQSVSRSPTSESAIVTTTTTTTTTAPPPAPPPSFIFRGHDAPVNSLEFFNSNALLATGDDEGWIYIWDLWKRRQIIKWHAHPSSSVLALKAVPCSSGQHHLDPDDCGSKKSHAKKRTSGTRIDEAGFLLSHGRDHVIHIWDIRTILERSHGSKDRTGYASRTENKDDASLVPEPVPVYSLPVNALNFCAMSVLVVKAQLSPPTTSSTTGVNDSKGSLNIDSIAAAYQHLYIAVPSTTDVSKIDVYDLVKPERTFAAIGRQTSGGTAGSAVSRIGQSAVMALQIFRTQLQPSEQEVAQEIDDQAELSSRPKQLHILAGYECGTVTLFREEEGSVAAPRDSNGKSKRKMDVVWSIQLHKEPVLSLDISDDLRYGASCGADNTLVKYTLSNTMPGVPETLQVSLKTSGGRGSLRIRSDGKIVVVAGWDGRLRVFAFKSLKPLAVLKYHREDLKGLALARIIQSEPDRKADAPTREINQDSEQGDEHDLNSDKDDESDTDYNSDEDSDREELLANQEKWFQRHWIAAAGKENRISLWDIY